MLVNLNPSLSMSGVTVAEFLEAVCAKYHPETPCDLRNFCGQGWYHSLAGTILILETSSGYDCHFWLGYDPRHAYRKLLEIK